MILLGYKQRTFFVCIMGTRQRFTSYYIYTILTGARNVDRTFTAFIADRVVICIFRIMCATERQILVDLTKKRCKVRNTWEKESELSRQIFLIINFAVF